MARLLKLVAWCALLLAAGPAMAQTTVPVTPVYHFGGFTGTGNAPLAPLVQAPDGSFYGTTYSGGGGGTIFRFVPAADPTMPGTATTVHQFTATGPTGHTPQAGLVRAADGSYYGTTSGGGAGSGGTIYRMVVGPNGMGGLTHTVSLVHAFSGTDGSDSHSALLQDSDGSFYGTTAQGGFYGFGTVFRLVVAVDPTTGAVTATLTTLHAFDGSAGRHPQAALIKRGSGTFYGTTREGGAGGAGTVFALETAPDGLGGVLGFVSALHHFDASLGAYPHGALVEGPDGAFYGTATRGGLSNLGSVFRLFVGADPLTGFFTTTFNVLHHFDATTGALPDTTLVRGQNDALYGTTSGDGSGGLSTVFRILLSAHPVTGEVSAFLTVLHDFDAAGAPTVGTTLHAPVVQAADGSFYGTAGSGGAHNEGTIFRIVDKLIPTLSWSGPSPITYGTPLGASQLNATAAYGGVAVEGTFDYSPPAETVLPVGTHTLTVLFTPIDTATYASVAASVSIEVGQATPFLSWNTPAPILTGTALSAIQLGAIAFAGTQVDGTYDYTPPMGTALPLGRHELHVVFTPTDPLNYATAAKSVWIVVYSAAASTGPLKVLHSFDQLATPFTSAGTGPYSALFQAADGSFYGTTPYGGGPGITGGPEGQGTVFRMDLAGTVTPLYSFASPGPAFPYAGLVQGADGKFYGATYGGGADAHGALYRVDASTTPATVTTLHEFNAANFDGGGPYLATPTFGADGTLYGSTLFGGTGGMGTFYQLDPGGVAPTYRVMHHLTAAEGINPWPSLLPTTDGWFYSPVVGGNAEGNGAILRVNAAGDLETMHAFRFNNGYATGRIATGQLIKGQDGYLYGTTFMGGGTGNGIWTCQGFGCGTVFRLDVGTTPPTLTPLHTFTGLDVGTDGAFPISGLLQASDGFLYGTTSEGGTLGIGTVFRLDPTAPTTTDPLTGWVTGAIDVLHTFDGANGATPWAALTQGTDSAIYGATTAGGDHTGGTIFRFKVPTLTWPAPAPIDDGTALGPELNATASFAGSTVPGTFVYTPPAGTVLPPGTHRLSATFTPADTSTYFPAKKSVTITVQAVGAPTVTIDQAAGQADPTNASPIQFAVAFSAPVSGFDASDVSLAGSTVGGTLVASVSGSGSSYTVSVTGMSGTGILVASIPAGAASNAAGDASVASTSTDNTVTFDGIVPTVTIDQAPGQADPTNSSPVLFTVTFSEPVLGFDASDVSFVGSTIGGTLTANVTGSGASYVVSVTGMSGSGTIVASIAGGAAEDVAGNASEASTSTDNAVTFDGIGPTVTINQAASQADPTNGSPILFTVTFSEPVTGFDAADVSLAGSTVGGTLSASVSGTGATYTVLVTGMSGTGTVTTSIPAGAASDGSGDPSAASTSTDDTVTFDDGAPTVTIDQAPSQADPARSSPVLFAVTFSEPVLGFDASDVSFAGSTVGGTLAAGVTGSGTSYTVAASGMSGVGAVVVSIPAGAAADAAGNASAPSTSSDDAVGFDDIPPTVTVDQASGQPDPTNASPVLFSVHFSEPVGGLDGSDVSFAGSTVGGSLVAAVTGSGADYTITVSGMSGTGTVRVSLAAAVAADAGGNPSAPSTSTDNVILYDAVAPTAFITQAPGQSDPTNDSAIEFVVIFSEPVTGFGPNGVSFTSSTVGGALTASVTGSGAVYTVTVTGMTGSGTVRVYVLSRRAYDLAGNPNSGSISNDDSVTFDGIAPTVRVRPGLGQVNPTNASSIAFEIDFSEPVTGFTGAVSFAGSTVGGTLVATVTNAGGGGTSPSRYTLRVTGMTGTGTVRVSVAAGAAQDAVGNPSLASTNPDNTVTFDGIPPTVMINQAAGQADPTAGSPIRFTVAFSEPVSGFTGSDVSLAGSTVGGTLSRSVTGSGANYTVSVTGMSGSGTVRAAIAAGAAVDSAGNTSLGSTSTDNTVTFDGIAPTVTINQAAGQADPDQRVSDRLHGRVQRARERLHGQRRLPGRIDGGRSARGQRVGQRRQLHGVGDGHDRHRDREGIRRGRRRPGSRRQFQRGVHQHGQHGLLRQRGADGDDQPGSRPGRPRQRARPSTLPWSSASR